MNECLLLPLKVQADLKKLKGDREDLDSNFQLTVQIATKVAPLSCQH